MLIGVVAPACSPLRISSQRADAVLCRNPRVYLCLPHRCCATKSFLSRIPAVPYYHSLRPSHPIVIAGAADSTPPSSTSAAAASGKAIVPDEGFSLSKFSFGVIGLVVGGSLLLYGFGAYFNILPGSEWSALMLTYGFPLAIIGMALKYAELKPVPCITYSDAQDLRETCATPVLKQVRNDVTRFRYGDEQHLDEALKRIFQYGQGSGISRRNGPTLQMIREQVTEDGKYSLVLVFEAEALQLSDFEQRQYLREYLIWVCRLSLHHSLDQESLQRLVKEMGTICMKFDLFHRKLRNQAKKMFFSFNFSFLTCLVFLICYAPCEGCHVIENYNVMHYLSPG